MCPGLFSFSFFSKSVDTNGNNDSPDQNYEDDTDNTDEKVS